MKNFLFLFGFLWKIWFLIFFIISFILLLPLFTILVSKKKYFKILNYTIRKWCQVLLSVIGIRIDKVFEQKIDNNKNYIFCANHKSYIDIAIIYATIKTPVIFIGKEEIKKYPIFGKLYSKIVITVKRTNIRDSFLAYKKTLDEIKNKKNIIIFPEGGIFKKFKIKEFKNGAFKLAVKTNTDIIPVTLNNNSKLFSKYFCFPGKTKIIIHKHIKTNNKDFLTLKNKTWTIINNKLDENR